MSLIVYCDSIFFFFSLTNPGCLFLHESFIWGPFPGTSTSSIEQTYRTPMSPGRELQLQSPDKADVGEVTGHRISTPGPHIHIPKCLEKGKVQNHIKHTLWPLDINITNKQNQHLMCTLICWQIFKKLTSEWMTNANTTTKPLTQEKNNSQSKPPGL